MPISWRLIRILCQTPWSTIHSIAHTPAMKSLHGMGSHMHSSWAAAPSDPSEECMVSVSTLERQHMASWSGTTSSSRATLSRGSNKRAGIEPSHNGHPSTNGTEKREHCECSSSKGSTVFVCVWLCVCAHMCAHYKYWIDPLVKQTQARK